MARRPEDPSRAPNPRRRSPVVICMGEPGHRKEEYLCKSARYARERGMSVLAVDLLGPDGGLRFDKIVGRSDLETAVRSVMDFLLWNMVVSSVSRYQ